MALLDIVSDTGGVFQTRGDTPTLPSVVSLEGVQAQERGDTGTLLDVVGDASHVLARGDVGIPTGIFSLEMLFITQPLALTGLMAVWLGAAWEKKPVRVWSGAAWVEKPLKVWNGAAWVESS